MTRKCCVPGCKSNYKSTVSKEGYTSVFKVPEEAVLRQKWITSIPRKDWTVTSNSYVCIKHFSESDIDRVEIYKDKNGDIKEHPRKKPLLVSGAFPTIFPHLPLYLSKPKSVPRKDPNKRRSEQTERQEAAVKNFLDSDIITDYQCFMSDYVTVLGDMLQAKEILHFMGEDAVVFYILDVSDIPKVKCSVKVDKDLISCVVVNNFIVDRLDLAWILPQNLKLNRWSQIQNLLVRYLDREKADILTIDTLRTNALHSLKLLESELKISENVAAGISEKVMFLREQLEVLFSQKKKYSVHTIMVSFMVYMQSSGCYSALRENNILSLPHTKHLQQLCAKLGVSHISNEQNLHFLKQSSKFLMERDKIVTLQLDEIYVKECINYKGEKLSGFATNNVQYVATTVQAFMVTSAFGNYKEVVSLIPVKNMKSDELREMIINVLKLLYDCGFQVLTIISDNNRLNRSAFRLLSGSLDLYSFTLPPFPGEIFFMFDTVHILKCVRNNWLNLKDGDKTFLFPTFEEHDSGCGSTLMEAKFSALRELYRSESGNVIKSAPKLNYKTLFPSSIERQNVNLVVNIFNETTYAALLSSDDLGTAAFVKIILTWWTIVNIKDTVKGKRTRNPLAYPFYTVDDDRLQFLNKFLKWLLAWKNLNLKDNFLSNDTFNALYCSTFVLCKIITVGLSKYEIPYVLPGKFQTDCLEHRFSLYRQLSGANYNVSVTQISESEKKLRIKSLLGLHSARFGNVSFNTDVSSLLTDCEVRHEGSVFVKPGITDEFQAIFSCEFLKHEIVNEPGFLYVCGYVTHKMTSLLTCDLCVSLLTGQKEKMDDYFSNLNRGGLAVPSDFVIDIGVYIFSVMQMLISEKYESLFLAHEYSHKKILLNLALEAINSNLVMKSVVDDVCFCNSKNTDLVVRMAGTFCNILLNNYRKNRNSNISERKTECKKRKMSTLMH